MPENIKKTPGKPRNVNKSNTVRSVIFTFFLVCLAMLLVANLNYGGTKKNEVPISEVIQRANSEDGNIAKIGLKATALLIAQDFETTFPWNTKEDINIEINALEGKTIGEGLGAIQDYVWTVQFPEYVKAIGIALVIGVTAYLLRRVLPCGTFVSFIIIGIFTVLTYVGAAYLLRIQAMKAIAGNIMSWIKHG